MEIKHTDLALLKVLQDNTTSNFPRLDKRLSRNYAGSWTLKLPIVWIKVPQKEWEQHREVLVVKFAGLNYSLLQFLEGSEVADIFDLKKTRKVLDISGIYLMIRSLIETYLTIYYLNFECRDHEERQRFRNDLYKRDLVVTFLTWTTGKSLVRIEYKKAQGGKEVIGAMHTYLPETGELVTAGFPSC